MAKQINSELIEKALCDYVENNLSIKSCAIKYGIGATTLSRYIKKTKTNQHVIDTRIYTYNQDYFETIDTEDKAYWLGFIAADGGIINNGYGLEIGLKRSDRRHLEKFIDSIQGEYQMIKDIKHKDGKGKYHEISRVRVMSKKMCDDLSKYGIIPNKGYLLGFPNFLDNHLLRHYLRGYFDGDGSISTNGKNRNGSPKWALNIIATEDFLINYMEHLLHIDITKVKLQPKCGMYVWNKVGINQITSILNYFYGDSTIYLERKHAKYLNICSPEHNSH